MSSVIPGETLVQIRDSLSVALSNAPSPSFTEADINLTLPIETNPQTGLDRAMQTYLVGCLPGIFDAPILSEEDKQTVSGVRRWNIDPIDGTINFWDFLTAPLPFALLPYAVSVALQDEAGKSLVSVADVLYPGSNPKDSLTYSAVARMGAWKNGMPLYANLKPDSGIVAFGHPGPQAAKRTSDALRKMWEAGIQTVQFGSACADICRVTDLWSAFFEYGLKSWDIAAAVLIAQEAGCATRVVPTGEPYAYDVIVARNRRMLRRMARLTGINRRAALKGWFLATLKKTPL